MRRLPRGPFRSGSLAFPASSSTLTVNGRVLEVFRNGPRRPSPEEPARVNPLVFAPLQSFIPVAQVRKPTSSLGIRRGGSAFA
jgi:hypothetical protein